EKCLKILSCNFGATEVELQLLPFMPILYGFAKKWGHYDISFIGSPSSDTTHNFATRIQNQLAQSSWNMKLPNRVKLMSKSTNVDSSYFGFISTAPELVIFAPESPMEMEYYLRKVID
ncbi:unnamed protein product, partial [Allacma fusca]